MARPIASSIYESLPQRSIYVRVIPTPVGLTERRSVLRALQQHGEIEVFKKLEDDSSFISITANRNTANKMISKSPLQYDIAKEPSLQSSTSPKGASRKSFHIEIFPAPDYKHRSRVSLSPLYGPWPEEKNAFNDSRSFAMFALKSALPKNIAGVGLSDWETGGQISSEADARSDSAFQIQERIRRSDRGKLAKAAEERILAARAQVAAGQVEAMAAAEFGNDDIDDAHEDPIDGTAEGSAEELIPGRPEEPIQKAHQDQ